MTIKELAEIIFEMFFVTLIMGLFIGMLAFADSLEEERGIKNNMLSSGTLISDTMGDE